MVKLISRPPHRDGSELEADFRRRPFAWIGSIRHCLVLTVHLFLQEALESRCSSISIEILDDYTFTVSGIRYETDLAAAEHEISLLEDLFTGFYEFSEYLDFSWGMKVLALASEHLTIEMRCRNKIWSRRFVGGVLVSSANQESIDNDLPLTRITVSACVRNDTVKISKGDLDAEILSGLFMYKAALFPGLQLAIRDSRNTTGIQNSYQFRDGLRSLLRMSEPTPGYDFDQIVDGELITQIASGKDESPLPLRVNFACHLTSGKTRGLRIASFVNAQQTVCHGIHVDAFLSAAVQAINQCADELDDPYLTTEFEHLDQDAVAQAISLLISVWYPEPESDNALGWRLSNRELYGPIFNFAYKQIMEWSKANPQRMESTVFWYCPDVDD